ncbi:hypothetical protein ACTFIZ_006532 [Dictyostelium cf. discoideum]
MVNKKYTSGQNENEKLMDRIEKLDLSESNILNNDFITNELRKVYPEYNRKPLKGFKQLVEKAMNQIIKNLSSCESSDNEDGDNKMEESDGDDVEIISPPPSSNILNEQLTSQYKQNIKNTPPTTTPAKRNRDEKTPSNVNSNNNNSNSNNNNNNNATNNSSTTTNNVNTPNSKPKKKLKNSTNGNNVFQFSNNNNNNNNNNGNNKDNNLNNGLIPTINFSNLGGVESCLRDIREHIEYPICHPEIYSHLGVEPPRGILLHGPSGCGKTLLAKAIAGELKVPLFAISATEITSGVSGESEARIRTLFSNAIAQAPCIIFIDEIDAIAPKRESASKDMERRIVSQLLTCMDSLNYLSSNNSTNEQNEQTEQQQQQRQQQQQQQQQDIIEVDSQATTTTTTSTQSINNKQQKNDFKKGHVIVIGATNRPESLDTALRIGGRFDKEICLGIPDQTARCKILKVITSKMRLENNFDYEEIATLTPGYVGADINLLVKEAATNSVNRIFTSNLNGASSSSSSSTNINNISLSTELLISKEPLEPEKLDSLYIEMIDFKKALKKVVPAAKREGFATIPNVTWDDVGALSGVREELTNSILRPIRFPKKYKNMGIDSPAGVLMYGPPGCGKTLLAKAIASECQANFISVKGPELLNKYVGESERAVRQVFQRAAASSPCVIFFDEFDALAPKRGGGDGGGNQATERVVNQLLTEMDGLEKRSEVFIIAATNRPDIIDAAMCRPGRLDKMVYVPLPSPEERCEILKTLTHKIPIHQDVDLIKVGTDLRCHSFSGADLSLLVKEAANHAISRGFDNNSTEPDTVTMEDFIFALSKIKPSVSRKDELMYDKLNNDINKSRDKKPNNSNNIPITNNNSNNNNNNMIIN